MSNSSAGAPLGEALLLIGNLFGHSAEIGMGILKTLSGGSQKALRNFVQGRESCGPCDIPAPCWEPQPLGNVTSYVAAGGKATVRFRITNCGFSGRTITFLTAKPIPGLTFSPATLTLGPLERGVVEASYPISPDAKKGFEEELVIFVRGCRNYYLRWIIKVAECGVDMCNEVEINDCPDMIHHWYDHFYCLRHCQDQRQPGTVGINPNVTPSGQPGVTGGG